MSTLLKVFFNYFLDLWGTGNGERGTGNGERGMGNGGNGGNGGRGGNGSKMLPLWKTVESPEASVSLFKLVDRYEKSCDRLRSKPLNRRIPGFG